MRHMGPNIILDGLKFAIDPTNANCYQGGTNIKDLVSSTQGELINNPPFTGGTPSFIQIGKFNEGNKFINSNIFTKDIAPPTTTGYTFSAWLNVTFVTLPVLFGTICIYDYKIGGNGYFNFQLFSFSGEIRLSFTPQATGQFLVLQTQAQQGEWFNFTATTDNVNGTNMYYNGGEEILTTDDTFELGEPAEEIFKLGNITISDVFTPKLGYFSIYDRVLSSSEVQQNYLALKPRFL